MDEQQSNFKVTDRRLFNADGSPREVPPEERPAPEPPKPEPPTKAEDTPVQPIAASAPETTEPEPEPETVDADYEDREPTPEEVAAARDPASFLNFLMSIASNAASALGMMEHPVTHERGVDLELGKHWIDVLGMLQKKTKGNLTAQETQMIESLLADLRMQFVSLSNATPKTRSFSGSDITGGG
jgi:outer membrane biosynthesis protein TonB